MRTTFLALFLGVFLLLGGCASIPPDAPELSAQLGARIAAMKAAHFRLLEQFFLEKKRQIDQFIQEVWVPVFASEVFSNQTIEKAWNEVAASKDPKDRVKFITTIAPPLQKQINAKRLELIRPLDELEAAIRSKLETEYHQITAINNTLTAFLLSASKVDENRRRYLELIGVADKNVENVISDTNAAVSNLVTESKSIAALAKDAEQFREKISTIIKNLRK